VSFYRIVDERIEPLGSEEAAPVGTPKIWTQQIQVHFQ
jgi:hypothetical protein